MNEIKQKQQQQKQKKSRHIQIDHEFYCSI